jgi:hypothetical protein
VINMLLTGLRCAGGSGISGLPVAWSTPNPSAAAAWESVEGIRLTGEGNANSRRDRNRGEDLGGTTVASDDVCNDVDGVVDVCVSVVELETRREA